MRCQVLIQGPQGTAFEGYLSPGEASFVAWAAAQIVCPCEHASPEDFLLKWGKVTEVRVTAQGWTIWVHSLSDPWGWYSRELRGHKDWVAFRMATCHNNDSRVFRRQPAFQVPTHFSGETK